MQLLCQQCQKRMASVYFTQIVNNTKVEMYLCEQCAKEKGKFSFESPLNMNGFLSGLINFNHNVASQSSAAEDLMCDKCGMSYREFQKVGKLGCSNCYEVFSERLKPLLRRLHGSAEHHGRLPGKGLKNIEVPNEMDSLKDLLNKAIKNEEYEKAAEIRDKIKSMEAGKGQ